jgi:hypothetical protein
VYLSAPSRPIYLAVPIHSMAGVSPRLGGAFDFAGDILGSVFGAITGANNKSAELKNQRKMVETQYGALTDIARLQTDFGNRQIDAYVQTERIRAANELAAINAAYSAHLQSQRVQKQVASDALSTQLVAQTQAGIFGLSQTGLQQAGSLATTYPRTAATTIGVLVLGTALAIAWMNGRGRRSKRRRGAREEGARRFFAPPPPPSPSPMFSPPVGAAA